MSSIVKFKLKALTGITKLTRVFLEDINRNQVGSLDGAYANPEGEFTAYINKNVPVGSDLLVFGDTYTEDSVPFKAFTGVTKVKETAPAITKVIFFGASILGNTLTTYDPAYIQDLFASRGAAITVYNEALGGNGIERYNERLAEVMTEHAADAETTLFVVHGPGNSIGVYPHNEDLIRNGLTQLCQNIKNNGFKLALSTITYRQPPSTKVSEAYNVNIVEELIATYADVALDLYAVSYENRLRWFNADGVHPNAFGREANLNHIVDRISSIVGSDTVIPNTVDKMVFQFGDRLPFGNSKNVISRMDTPYPVYDQAGNWVENSYLTMTGVGTGVNFKTNGGVGDATAHDVTDYSVTNQVGLSDSVFIGGTGAALKIDLTQLKLDPEADYLVEVTGTRESASSDRIGIFTLGDSVEHEIDATVTPSIVISNTVKGAELIYNGITLRIKEGSTYAYLSMASISKAA